MHEVMDPEDFRVKVRVFLSSHLPAGWSGIGALGNVEQERAFLAKWRKTLYENRVVSP
jgi:hypothetical protein